MSIPSGFLLINKPPGPTSHDVVDAVRRITGVQRVGHAGTLDPFADGLLIVGVGREATKQLDQFKALPKTYLATLRLGATSDTHDPTGRVAISNFQFPISKRDIEQTLLKFVGEIDQVPPMYSAKKVGGKKLYELARDGTTIERTPTKVAIHSLRLLEYYPGMPTLEDSLMSVNSLGRAKEQTQILSLPPLFLEIACSRGTYIRALARDLGAALGCGALLEQLTRTRIGPFTLRDAVTLDRLDSSNWYAYLSSGDDLEARGKKLEVRVERQHSISLASSFQLPAPPTKVLVFGTFDRLHPGHIDFFRQARCYGDTLIVGVGRDSVVKQIKKRLPLQNEQERLKELEHCGVVDEALLLPENPDDRFTWIKKISPGIIALGYDQTTFTGTLVHDLKTHNIPCRVVRLQPYHPELYKSSKI